MYTILGCLKVGSNFCTIYVSWSSNLNNVIEIQFNTGNENNPVSPLCTIDNA